MTVTKSRTAAPARPARKSPLRTATLGGMAPAGTGLTTAEILTAGTGLRRESVPAPDLRRMEISEFTAWLRSRTNKHHRPFQADTIAAYADAARALHEWTNGHDIDGDFTACDTAMLNRFFADYLASHGQGGTNTRQRNLGTCSPGWKKPAGTRTRGPQRCTGTPRRRSGPRRWPRNSSTTCSSSLAADGPAASWTCGTKP